MENNKLVKMVAFSPAFMDAVENGKISGTDLKLYLNLFDFLNSKDGCTKSNATLAKEMGVLPRQIKRILDKLENLNIITRKVTDGNTRIIFLSFEKTDQQKPNERKKPKIDYKEFREELRQKAAADGGLIFDIADRHKGAIDETRRFSKLILKKDNYGKMRIYDCLHKEWLTEGESSGVFLAAYREAVADFDAMDAPYPTQSAKQKVTDYIDKMKKSAKVT